MIQKDYLGKSLLIITLATIGATVLYAWTGAQSTPPNGNIGVPINSSILPQTKSGDLTLGASTKFTAPQFCVGSNCVTSLQSRVTGICNSGSSIRVINVDGTVTCQTDNTGGSVGDNLGSGGTPSGPINMGNNLFYSGHFYHTSGSYFYLPGPNSPFYGTQPAGDGKVLTSDPLGYAYWKQPTIASGIPAGAVMYFNLSSCPSGWIPADGTSGTPDLRGEFIRSLDNGRGIDAGRTLASWQADMLKDHTHLEGIPGDGGAFNQSNAGSGGSHVQTANPKLPTSDGGVTVLGKEVRPRNVALLACIKS